MALTLQDLLESLKRHEKTEQGDDLYLVNAPIIPIWTNSLMALDESDWKRSTSIIRFTLLPHTCVKVSTLIRFYEKLLTPKGFYYLHTLQPKRRTLTEMTKIYQTNVIEDRRKGEFVNIYTSVTHLSLPYLLSCLKTEAEVLDLVDKHDNGKDSIWLDIVNHWTEDDDLVQPNLSEIFTYPKHFYSALSQESQYTYQQEVTKFMLTLNSL